MSAYIKILAGELDTKGQAALENIKSINITSSLDSPAVSMSAVLAPYEPPRMLGSVKAYADGKLLFEGTTDSQKTTISGGGVLTRLEARSHAALLLDNQAQPCVMMSAHITSVFNRFIAPYGYTLSAPKGLDYLPMYTVRNGMSEWDALVYFTRRIYGVTPYVIYSQVMVSRPYSGANPFRISNTRDGAAFSSLTHEFIPYNILSSVYLRDDFGIYSTVVHNSAAKRTKTARKRFVIPSNEYMDKRGLDANQRIKRSMLSSERVVVELPGVIDIETGRAAEIVDRKFTLYNLMVAKREYIVDESGIITRLTLQSSVYYE